MFASRFLRVTLLLSSVTFACGPGPAPRAPAQRLRGFTHAITAGDAEISIAGVDVDSGGRVAAALTIGADGGALRVDGGDAAAADSPAAAAGPDEPRVAPTGADAAVVLFDIDGALRWQRTIGGVGEQRAGAVCLAGEHVLLAVELAAPIRLDDIEVVARSRDGRTAAVIALDAVGGHAVWARGLIGDADAAIRDLIALPDGGALAVGAFSGTIRVGDQVLTSAGGLDGFAIALAADGAVRWALRAGGASSDAIGSAALLADGRLAIGGTFSGIAELRGVELTPRGERSIYADGFVAVLDSAGAVAWALSLGGDGPDTVGGVAATADGGVLVGGGFRDAAWLGESTAAGSAGNGFVAGFSASGEPRFTTRLGGDAVLAVGRIAASGGAIWAAARFDGPLHFADQTLPAGTGGGAALLVLGDDGSTQRALPIATRGPAYLADVAASPAGVAFAGTLRVAARADGAASSALEATIADQPLARTAPAAAFVAARSR